MDPVLRAVLLSWDWRVDVLFVLTLAGTLYMTGWLRLRQRARIQTSQSSNQPAGRDRQKLTASWRPAVYLLGLLIIGLALISPIDVLAGQLFSMHMIQHLLLIMIGPPLMLIANPLPFILWGLPAPLRRKAGRGLSRLLAGSTPFRARLRSVTSPGVTWMFWVIAIIGWHDPNAYNAALQNDLVHDLEHISFFLAGILFWWHVTGAGPRIHKQHGLVGRIAFVLSVIPPNMLTGIALAFASEPVYGYRVSFLGLSLLEDQQLGGVIMWIPGSMMYIMAALILAGQLLQSEQNKPALPESNWATEQTLAAPGLEK
jgi:putative membrane protein